MYNDINLKIERGYYRGLERDHFLSKTNNRKSQLEISRNRICPFDYFQNSLFEVQNVEV